MAHEMIKEEQVQQAKSYNHDQKAQPGLIAQYDVGIWVFWKDLSQKKIGAKGKFLRPYLGPYKVLEIKGDNIVVLQLPDGPKQVHVNNVSQATSEMIILSKVQKMRVRFHMKFIRTFICATVY